MVDMVDIALMSFRTTLLAEINEVYKLNIIIEAMIESMKLTD